MNTGTAQAITSVLGGATQGVLDAYKIKAMSDASKKNKHDAEYAKKLAAIGAPAIEPPLDTGVKPEDGMPPSKEGFPTNVDSSGNQAPAEDTSDGYDYQPSRFAAMPKELDYFKNDIAENEAKAKLALEYGNTADYIMFKRYARESAKLTDVALDESIDKQTRSLKLKEMIERRRAMGLIDGFDLAMQDKVTQAENFIAQGTENPFWPKTGTLKPDRQNGTASYTQENGETRVITKQERDMLARRFEYPKAGNDMTSEAISYRGHLSDELKALKAELSSIDENAEKPKGFWASLKEKVGLADKTDAATDVDKIKAALKADIADRQKTLKGLDKQIRKGLSTEIEPTEGDVDAPDAGGDEAEPAPAAGTLDTSATASEQPAATNDAGTPPQFKSGSEAKAWIQGTYKDKIGSGEVVEVVINGKPVQVKL